GRPYGSSARGPGGLEQRHDRGLVAQVVNGADNVESKILGEPAQAPVRTGRQVPAQADAEAPPQVRSSVGILLRPVRSMRMTSLSSGSGQATNASTSSQSPGSS